MAEDIGHKCGIAAVYLFDEKENVVPPLGSMLLQLQHRGKRSAGITTYNPDRAQRLDSHRELGRVNSVFREGDNERKIGLYQKYRGYIGIGSVRYPTSGARYDPEIERFAIQPFENHGNYMTFDWFAFAFNGNIANNKEVQGELEEDGHYFAYELDTETIRRWLRTKFYSKDGMSSDKTKIEDSIIGVFSEFSEKFQGAYSMVFLNALGQLAILRDPHGIRPLVYGHNDKIFAVSSESLALEKVGFNLEDIKDVKPGEIILVSDSRIRKETFAESNRIAHC
ncbi:MAG: hypothetical protein AABX59_02945, partial [Nanoarchaeota archaeon]